MTMSYSPAWPTQRRDEQGWRREHAQETCAHAARLGGMSPKREAVVWMRRAQAVRKDGSMSV
jgi:hypothetical protein